MIKISIHEYRRKSRLTQRELAFKIGVTEQYIGKIERGKCYPSISLLLKIADMLKMNHTELYIDIIANYKGSDRY